MSPSDDKLVSISQTVAQALYARDIAAQRLGINIDFVDEGVAELSMTVKDWMIQGHDICHGGYIFLLADTAMAYASNGRNKANLAMNANIDFLRPAKLGENLTASAVEGNKSKNTGLYDLSLIHI